MDIKSKPLRAGVHMQGPADGLGLNPSCITCSRFNEPMELCNHFKAKPPARIIAFGCDQYLDTEEIPY
jgi:hypothetical protein